MSMPKGHKSENGYATVTSIEGAKTIELLLIK